MALTWCRRHIWHTTRENKGTKEQGKQWKQQVSKAVFYCDVPCVDIFYTKRAFANNFTKVTIFIIIFYYNYYKSCYLGKIVSNIFGNCTVDFGMEVWQIWHAFPTAPIVAWCFPRTQPICYFPASVRENTNTILRTTCVFPTTFLVSENFDVPLIENRIWCSISADRITRTYN